MLNVTDLKNGTYYEEDGAPYEVLKYEHIKMGRGNATIKVKVRNVVSGAIVTKSYISGKRLEEADLSQESATFKYRTSSEFVFILDGDDEIEIDRDAVGDKGQYLLKNMRVQIVFYEDVPISIKLPIKVTYMVKEAPPDARGNSANASYKEVILENGLKVKTPMFIRSNKDSSLYR